MNLTPPYLRDSACLQVVDALTAEGAEVRFVGGCVRDALLGREIRDIDLATPDPPDRVTKLLTRAGLKVVPTGIEHGTVMAVVDHRPFEITTLRRDVACDGRHAEVAFTDDWQEDAARRDFTMNALSLSPDGGLHDYFSGAEDARAGVVRFIGRAEDRIREDYLRIMRFFRFHAHYGRSTPDEAALSACTLLAEGLGQISVERIREEFLKTLLCANPMPVLRLMEWAGVLGFIVRDRADWHVLAALVSLEQTHGADGLRRLAALCRDGQRQATGRRLKMSVRQIKRLARMDKDLARLTRTSNLRARTEYLYEAGAEAAQDVALLNWATDIVEDREDEKAWRGHLTAIAQWTKPVFPLRGTDLIDVGVPAGPAMGAVLAQTERWWLNRGFDADRPELLAHALGLLRG